MEIGRNSGREFGVRFLAHPVGCLIVPAGVVPGPDRYQTILLGDRGTRVCACVCVNNLPESAKLHVE